MSSHFGLLISYNSGRKKKGSHFFLRKDLGKWKLDSKNIKKNYGSFEALKELI